MHYRITSSRAGDPLWRHIAEHSPQTIRWIDDPADDGDYQCFVAVGSDDACLGVCVIDIGEMGFGPLGTQTIGFLEEIRVLRPYRRRGIGTALLRAALDAAWQRGAAHVRWTVDYEDAGLAFYEALRFAFLPNEDRDRREPERTYTVVAVNPRILEVSARLLEGAEREA
jgi:GNAT superfamily N-acetyltransferase